MYTKRHLKENLVFIISLPKDIMINYDIISKFRRSPIRIKILTLLQEPKTVMDLTKPTNMSKSSVSRIFLDMAKDGLIDCLSPNSNNYRYYKITEKGKEILKELN